MQLPQDQPDSHDVPPYRTGCSSASAGGPPLVVGMPSVRGVDAPVVGAGAGTPCGSISRIRAAAVLNRGCFEAGSQSVRVSSLAARGAPLGWSPASVSQ